MATVDFEYKHATLKEIGDWCLKNDPQWFIDARKKEKPEDKDVNFLALRRKFFEKFAPEKMPVAAEPTRTMDDWEELMRKALEVKEATNA